MNSSADFGSTYPLDSNLSAVLHYPKFGQPAPEVVLVMGRSRDLLLLGDESEELLEMTVVFLISMWEGGLLTASVYPSVKSFGIDDSHLC